MAIGPVEYVIVSFPGLQSVAELAPALTELIECVRLLDLVIVSKDADGVVHTYEHDELPGLDRFAALVGEGDGLVNTEDIDLAAEAIEPNGWAALLVWENVWADRFARAISASGGMLVSGERVRYQLVADSANVLGARV